eukprot:354979-Chlamydomonas_euryale.AAC.2
MAESDPASAGRATSLLPPSRATTHRPAAAATCSASATSSEAAAATPEPAPAPLAACDSRSDASAASTRCAAAAYVSRAPGVPLASDSVANAAAAAAAAAGSIISGSADASTSGCAARSAAVISTSASLCPAAATPASASDSAVIAWRNIGDGAWPPTEPSHASSATADAGGRPRSASSDGAARADVALYTSVPATLPSARTWSVAMRRALPTAMSLHDGWPPGRPAAHASSPIAAADPSGVENTASGDTAAAPAARASRATSAVGRALSTEGMRA